MATGSSSSKDSTGSTGKQAAARNEAIVSLSKRRGFVYPSSEIYGGTRSAWDYGPLGVELKENCLLYTSPSPRD